MTIEIFNDDITNESYSICTNEFIFSEYYYTFFDFLKVIISFCSASFLSVVFVSFFVYYPSKIKFQKLYEENKENYEYDPFLMSCLDEYYELEEKKEDDYLKTLINKYLYYNFDFRDKKYYIIMNYNFNDESYDYYLNDKAHVLPFEFLDTISRIYCVKYNCKNIYKDNFDNKEKLLDSYNKEEKEEEKEVKNTIFYSKTKNSIDQKNRIMDYTSNKFKYKGLLKEFSELIVGSDIYNSENKLVSNYMDLENDIFCVKKNDEFEVISQNENNISFKSYKNSIIS